MYAAMQGHCEGKSNLLGLLEPSDPIFGQWGEQVDNDERKATYENIKELEDWLEIPHNPKVRDLHLDFMNDYLCDLETKRYEAVFSETKEYYDIPTPIEELWITVDEFFDGNLIIKGHRKYKIKTLMSEEGVPFNALELVSNDDIEGIEYSYFVLSKDLIKQGYVLNKTFITNNKKRIRIAPPEMLRYSELGIECEYGWIFLTDEDNID